VGYKPGDHRVVDLGESIDPLILKEQAEVFQVALVRLESVGADTLCVSVKLQEWLKVDQIQFSSPVRYPLYSLKIPYVACNFDYTQRFRRLAGA
jgi:hypothetical protein